MSCKGHDQRHEHLRKKITARIEKMKAKKMIKFKKEKKKQH